jgi:hypothetical protein
MERAGRAKRRRRFRSEFASLPCSSHETSKAVSPLRSATALQKQAQFEMSTYVVTHPRQTDNQNSQGFTFIKFDGTQITV